MLSTCWVKIDRKTHFRMDFLQKRAMKCWAPKVFLISFNIPHISWNKLSYHIQSEAYLGNRLTFIRGILYTWSTFCFLKKLINHNRTASAFSKVIPAIIRLFAESSSECKFCKRCSNLPHYNRHPKSNLSSGLQSCWTTFFFRLKFHQGNMLNQCLLMFMV